MKTHILTAIVFLTAAFAHSATPEQEKAFIDSYKKAFEAKDLKALATMHLTDRVPKDIIAFFADLQLMDAGSPLASIELITPAAADLERFSEPMEMPDGKSYKMPFAPTKILVLKLAKKSAESSSQITSKAPVGEKDGKLVLLLPVPVK